MKPKELVHVRIRKDLQVRLCDLFEARTGVRPKHGEMLDAAMAAAIAMFEGQPTTLTPGEGVCQVTLTIDAQQAVLYQAAALLAGYPDVATLAAEGLHQSALSIQKQAKAIAPRLGIVVPEATKAGAPVEKRAD